MPTFITKTVSKATGFRCGVKFEMSKQLMLSFCTLTHQMPDIGGLQVPLLFLCHTYTLPPITCRVLCMLNFHGCTLCLTPRLARLGGACSRAASMHANHPKVQLWGEWLTTSLLSVWIGMCHEVVHGAAGFWIGMPYEVDAEILCHT